MADDDGAIWYSPKVVAAISASFALLLSPIRFSGPFAVPLALRFCPAAALGTPIELVELFLLKFEFGEELFPMSQSSIGRASIDPGLGDATARLLSVLAVSEAA